MSEMKKATFKNLSPNQSEVPMVIGSHSTHVSMEPVINVLEVIAERLECLRAEFARRPDPIVYVTAPEPVVNITVPTPNVSVTVPEAAAPNVHVSVPESKLSPAPVVSVTAQPGATTIGATLDVPKSILAVSIILTATQIILLIAVIWSSLGEF